MEISMDHLEAYVLDRYEGEYAVLQNKNGRTFDVLRDELPLNVREGDILHENEGSFVMDEKLTQESREKLKKLYADLAKKN
jgi:hypothetical protein